MNLTNIIYYLSAIVWVFPAVRQYKTKYFPFFLVLASEDIIIRIVKIFFEIQSNLLALFFVCLQILFLQDKNKYKTANAWLLPLFVIIAIVSISLNDRFVELYFALFLYLVVFFFIIVDFFKFTIDTHNVSLFLFVLTLYQTLNVLKIFNILFAVYEGTYYFIITLTVQIMIGIFFSVFAFGNPKLNFSLVSKKNLSS